VKRFTLTRGSEVLAEGVVWSDGRVSARTLGLVGSGYFDSVAAFEQARLLGGQSIVWIDETHEAKPRCPDCNNSGLASVPFRGGTMTTLVGCPRGCKVAEVGTMPKYTQTLIGETEHGDQVFAVEQEEKRGKLVSERMVEISTERLGKGWVDVRLEDLAKAIDERLGRAP
jgi:protein-L-isoaspartate O-methyltransferase